MNNAKSRYALNPIFLGAILAITILGLVLLQQTISFSKANRLQIALNNAAHVPWFFLVTWLIWHVDTLFLAARRRPIRVTSIALLLAVSLEAVQLFTHRDADLGDIGRNILGASAALFAIVATHYWRNGRRKRAAIAVIFVVILILSSFIRALQVVWVYSQRDAIAPHLVVFDRPRFPLRWQIRGDWVIVDQVNTASKHNASGVLLATLRSGLQWPGLTFREPIPNWNEYRWLVLHAYTEDEQPLPLEVRLETKSDPGVASTVSIELTQEAAPIRIPLQHLGGDRFGQLDDVRNLYLFSPQVVSNLQFYLESIFLE